MSIARDANGRNLVVSKMWELASHRTEKDAIIIRRVDSVELIPNMEYTWCLYERDADVSPAEKVSLQVSFPEKRVIDEEVNEDLVSVSRSESRAK